MQNAERVVRSRVRALVMMFAACAVVGCAAPRPRGGAGSPPAPATEPAPAPAAPAASPAPPLPDLGQVPPEPVPLPSGETYDYRPAQPDLDAEAASDVPPAWFVVALSLRLDSVGRVAATPGGVRSTWASWSAPSRKRQLQQAHQQAARAWETERELGKPAAVPRPVTTADVTGASPPTWATAVADPNRQPGMERLAPEAWSQTQYSARQSVLDIAAVREAALANDRWDREHQADIEEHQRQAAAKARQRFEAKVQDKLAGPAEAAEVADLANDPARFAKRTLKLQAQWSESVGRGMHLDDLGGGPVLIVALSPEGKRQPQVMLALDLKEYERRIDFFEGLPPKSRVELGSTVEVVVYVLGKPLDRELPCVGRILSVTVK